MLNQLIEQNYDLLNENDLYIWQYIQHHKIECQTLSIQALAKACNVSHSSILRFTKKLGLEGYSELKVYLKWEAKQEKEYDHHMVESITNSLHHTLDRLESTDFSQMVKMIYEAKRVFVYYTGDVQYNAANELKREFIYSKKAFQLIGNEIELDALLKIATKEDLFIIISLYGNHSTAIMLAKALTEMKIPKIAICRDTKNELRLYSEASLVFNTSGFKVPLKDDLYYDTTHYFLIINMLYIRYVEYVALQIER